jgi:hypothetical protein
MAFACTIIKPHRPLLLVASADLTTKMSLTATQLAALSRLFSSSVFHEMAKRGRSPLFARLLSELGQVGRDIARETVGSTFDAAFTVLRRSGLRDEYVYRAALTHNVLLGRHTLKTASMLTEFRAGACKADLAILNGTASVYEIKSERDSLARLTNQIANYRKVFAKIYVIVGEPHVEEVVRSTDEDIGVMSLVRWDRIRTVREAADRADMVCPVTIFDSLRLDEARTILSDLEVSVPDVPNTLLYGAMRDCFARLKPAEVHDRMVSTLRRTRSLESLGALIEHLPVSLKPAALSVPVRRGNHQNLINATRASFQEAITWT